jgi:hypothetical protein
LTGQQKTGLFFAVDREEKTTECITNRQLQYFLRGVVGGGGGTGMLSAGE